jgi:16S rRNA (guanine966-N2)-methyltransferase
VNKTNVNKAALPGRSASRGRNAGRDAAKGGGAPRGKSAPAKAAPGAPRNEVRIIAGAWRSRRIAFPGSEGLRPTPDRVRETLFNWLGHDLAGFRCLDLFAGSGALGFEALSRGAARVTMVERDAAAFRALADNARRLDSDPHASLGARLELVQGDALEFLRRQNALSSDDSEGSEGRGARLYDVVFADPPFESGLPAGVLDLLPPLLARDGRLYVESGASYTAPAPWMQAKSGRAGQVHFQMLRIP